MICANLRQLSLYDDMLVARWAEPRYGSPTPATTAGDDTMMTMMGTMTDTPEGKLRAELVGLLAEAVGEAGRRPGGSEGVEGTTKMIELIDDAHAKALLLQEVLRDGDQ